MDIKLQMTGLNKTYGHNKVVDDVNLNVSNNELVTLLGPSGSGKTTTMMMIAGFVEPDSGQVLLDGQSIVGVPPYRRNIGVVFQNYALFPHMSVAANVSFPLRQRGVSRAAAHRKALELLELVGLAGFDTRKVPQLSGGQQQRVALARALVFDPPLLIMDEPLSALDKRLREQMQGEIKRIQKAVGVTVLCVTHDQTEAFVLSDRIAVMNDGKILQVGAPRAVYDHPVNDFVAEFLGESNLLRGEVRRGSSGNKVFHTDSGIDLFLDDSASEETTTILIRPERATIHPLADSSRPHAPNGETVITGRVVQLSFVGSSMVYQVDCGGVNLTVRTPSVGAEPIAEGEEVTLLIGAHSCAPLLS